MSFKKRLHILWLRFSFPSMRPCEHCKVPLALVERYKLTTESGVSFSALCHDCHDHLLFEKEASLSTFKRLYKRALDKSYCGLAKRREILKEVFNQYRV